MFQQFNAKLFRASIIVSTGLFPCLLSLPVLAGQLSDGRSFFDHPPRLIRTAASTTHSSVPGASYQFTITVPKDAGEPLGAIKITQTENASTVTFDQKKTVAFAGDSFAGGPVISLADGGTLRPVSQSVTLDNKSLVNSADGSSGEVKSPQADNPGETIVVFDPPVPAGTTVTVDLTADSTPISGIYLFGITAYPVGEKGIGQFLGYGRLPFSTNSRF